MPNTIEILANVEFSPVNRPTIRTGQLRSAFETVDKRYLTGIQQVTDTEAVLDIGDVSSAGLIILINRSNLVSVNVGLSTSFPIKILPGQFCIFPPADSDIYVEADSDSADIEFFVFPSKVTES